MANRTLRTKMLPPVVLAVVGAGVILTCAVTALCSADNHAHNLNHSTALPLADLGTVRDGIGNFRRDP